MENSIFADMKEIWKDIPDYPKYQGSNIGRIRSVWFDKVRILKPCKRKSGYLYVSLHKDGRCKSISVHRLVWMAFNGTIPEGMEINHINEDKTDNRYPENLNLMTRKENANWGTAIQRRVEKQKGIRRPYVNQNLCKPVLQFTLDGEFVKEWPSTREANRNGFNQGHIAECCRGERKQHKGFIWKYKEC